MTIETFWGDDQQNLVVMKLPHIWTWDNVVQDIQHLYRLLSSVDHQVDVIIDNTRAMMYPDDVLTVLPQYAGIKTPDNLGKVVLAGTTGTLHRAAEVFSRVYIPLDLVDTLSDAYETLGRDPAENEIGQ